MARPDNRTREQTEREVARIAREAWGADPWSNPAQARIVLDAIRLLLELRRTRDTFPSIWPDKGSGS